jgi:hypothetical protein
MSRDSIERFGDEAPFHGELQTVRNRLAADSRTSDDLDSRLDTLTRWFQDADTPEMRRQIEQLRQWRKDHRVTHDQEHIEWEERVIDLEARVWELSRRGEVQERNHHQLCLTMASVLSRLQAVDHLADPTAPDPVDEIPY